MKLTFILRLLDYILGTAITLIAASILALLLWAGGPISRKEMRSFVDDAADAVLGAAD